MKLSVKQLVDFSCRTGDLVNAGPVGPTAQEGIRAHQKLQQAKTAGQKAEVKLSAQLTIDQCTVTVGGRVDLLDETCHPAVLEEIKSCLVAVEKIPKSTSDLHWAQLKIYGFLYLWQLIEQARDKSTDLKERANTAGRESAPIQVDVISTEPESVSLTLLWINIRDDSVRRETHEFQFDELKAFAIEAMRVALEWQRKLEVSRERTRSSASAMKFPFDEFRTGQRAMASNVYRAHRDAELLVCDAPTGVGKTISTLFPAAKALAEGHVKQVTYLTAKTSGRLAAFDGLKKMQAAGLSATSLVIQSKVLTCHCSTGRCERDMDGRCPLTIGFFDRLPDARDWLLEKRIMDAEVIDQAAVEFQLCPFELSLQMLRWTDFVFCDYNYVFDPLVRLSFYAESEKHIAFLIDEAHNLSDRARSMYSARLLTAQNRQVARDCASLNPPLVKLCKSLDRALKRWAKRCELDEYATSEKPDTVTRAVNKCLEEIQASSDSGLLPDSVWEWFKELFRYRVIEELFGEHHRTITRVSSANSYSTASGNKPGDIELRLMCLNASDKLRQSFEQVHSATIFSATLTPLAFHRNALGLPQEVKAMEIPSPFSHHNMACLVCTHIDTRYQQRERSKDGLIALIYSLVSEKRGNYLVFFPSYAYMEAVNEAFARAHPDYPVLLQQRRSSFDDRVDYLSQFTEGSAVLGFAIMGGIYGEGIDFTGDKLIGAMVIGTGLPPFDTEQSLIAEDYSSQGLNGFDYSARFPGFTRVLQTAGRVIRSESDRGVVMLVDPRFSESFYRALYPSHWRVTTCHSGEEVSKNLKGFWGNIT